MSVAEPRPRPTDTGARPLLEVEGLTVQYGAIRAVGDVSFRVGEGELVALIGSNGAGKSSTLRAIAGLIPAAGGEVRLAGESLRQVPAHELPRRGLVLVPEGRRVFGEMSVLDNLYLGAYTRSSAEIAEGLERVHALFPILGERSRQAAGTLSGGEQQMLAIGRGLMARPKVLLLDEPSLGLAPAIVRELFDLLRRLHRDGVTILLVEQNARMALEVADRAYVLQTGRIVTSGPAAELANSDEVRRRYLGVAEDVQRTSLNVERASGGT
jgi:branched-chain amino acid transport system ATP-binding protein